MHLSHHRRTTLHSNLTCLAGLALAMALFSSAAAADKLEDKNAVFGAAKLAVAHGEVEKTEMQGFAIVNTEFDDVPTEGGILIGFDLGLGSFNKNEVISALRPIYLTALGETTGRDVGRLSTGGRQDKVKRIVQAKAKPGYAVSKIRLQTAINIQCIRVTFSRLKGNSLDRDDSYSSTWIGTHQDNREDKVLESNGAPIVGIFGNRDDKQILALGLVHLPPVESETPAPVVKPITRRQQKKAETTEVATEPSSKASESTELTAEQAPVRTMTWLPYIIFGVVAVPMFVLLMLFLGKKKSPEIDPRPRKPRPKKQPQIDDEDIPMVLPADPEIPAKNDVPAQEPVASSDVPVTNSLSQGNVSDTAPSQAISGASDPYQPPPLPKSIADAADPFQPPPLPKTIADATDPSKPPPLPETITKAKPSTRKKAAKAEASDDVEVPLASPADPNDPYWNSAELMAKAIGPEPPSSAAPNASLFIGLVGLFFWCLPILGVPITITGLVFGVMGLKSSRPEKAMIGIGINALGLLFAIINFAASAYMAMQKHHVPLR